MQGRRPPTAFSLFMSNILLCILLAKFLNIIQGRNQRGGGFTHCSPSPNRTFKKYVDFIETVMSQVYVIYLYAEIRHWNQLMNSTWKIWNSCS